MYMTATYSPDDNKLRLYASSRLDKELYQRVRDAGFKWAPKQELFVAPMWTPGREDLLTELCGDIDDEDKSLTERAEERADRFEDYSDSRARDAATARAGVEQVSKRFEFGQPILVGHHSERKARKDAERIETGMRRAVKMWETSTYWTERAAGALAHAKYKELPEVRARRIKTIEADKRKQMRTREDLERRQAVWSVEGLTMPMAIRLAGAEYVSHCFTLAEYPRNPPASQYEGQMSVSHALEEGFCTVEQARHIMTKSIPAWLARCDRWIAHYDNRIAYETAMLAEQGGTAADKFDIEQGGTVLVGREWVAVLRVNRVAGKISSVSTNRRYARVIPIEEVQDYRAPSAEQAQAVKTATKLGPLCNYQGERFAHLTTAQWDAIYKDSRWYQKVAASEAHGAHRVRCVLGCHLPREARIEGDHHARRYVFVTDAKTVQPPAALAAAAAAPAVPAPMPADAAPRAVYQAPAPTVYDDMRESLRQGVQIVSAPQLFPTPPELAESMAALANLHEGARVLEPSAGTGRLLDAIQADALAAGVAINLVAVEVNACLSEGLRAKYAPAVGVLCADFLAEKNLGFYDAIVMNPPFVDGADIKHVAHALTLLKPGGKLVALCADGPRQNTILRPMIEARGGYWEKLPAGSFKSEGTAVPVALLVL